ncbi:uncharacterized protein LOC110447583 isoform X3 [Mizuhopecten yessoensis]|uniref:uncharacterized protein LOC110447583 isoform X3 n=1 Tax=Mizuhopecten yessoensis TaxID=6573 RepID=UPI000B45E40E|nr:uncharacterized protein LOC110447583 isoform X3 [Mizuhopecten yessoensis]
MSNSTPWQYQQGAQTSTGTGAGAVKLFNPAGFGAATSQPSNFVNNAVQDGQLQANGQKEASTMNSSWDWSPSQWHSGGNEGHNNQQSNANQGQGHDVPGNVDTSVYEGQAYDQTQQHQQYYNQQQYWDPNQQQNHQQVLNQQAQGQDFHGHQDWANQQYDYNQTWNNTDYSQQQSQPLNNHYDGQQTFQPHQENSQPYNIINQEQTQGHFNLEQDQDHLANQGPNQEHVYNQQKVENDGLNSSAASNYSGSLNQSSIHEDQGSTSGFYQNTDPEDVGFMGQIHVGEEPVVSSGIVNPPNVVHSSANDNAPLRMGMVGGEQLESTQDRTDMIDVISQVNHMRIQDNESSGGVSYSAKSVDRAQEQGFGIGQPVTSNDPPANLVQTNSGMMATADDQQSLGDWEVVPSQNLAVPGNHSRQSSTDNNVQFFIGSSRNSPGSGRGTGSPCSVIQGQGEEKTNLSVFNPQPPQVCQPPKPFQPDSMLPKYTSSPNITPETTVSTELGKSSLSNTGPPPSIGTPPSGRGGDNPFRKNGQQLAPTEPQQELRHGITGNVSSLEGSSYSEGVLSSKDSSLEPPSPILNTEDPSQTLGSRFGQKMKPQSPIMPRKESPFQPPARRRNISGSSETIEENARMEEVSRQDSRESLTRGIEHSKSMGSDRSFGAGSSRRSSGSDSQGQSDRDSSHSQDPHWKTRTNLDRRSRPPPGPSGSSRARAVMSPRRMEKHLQHNQERRVKHNMSPATTLWADSGELPTANILLAPAGPMPSLMSPVSVSLPLKAKDSKETEQVLSPVENLITSLTEHISKENTPEPEIVTKSKPVVLADALSKNQEERKRQEVVKERDRHERNSSIDRELEIVRRQEEEEKRELKNRKHNDNHGEHYSVKDQYQDSRGHDPRDSRDQRESRDHHDSRDRRDDTYDAYYDKKARYGYKGAAPLRDPNRDQYHGDERYDRPRSRNSHYDGRPSSRQSRTETDSERPRSRQEYSRDPAYKDGRYSSASKGGYDYDYYNQQGYHDSRYYNQGYYHDSRYNSAYYDEYYRQVQGQDQGQYNEHYDKMMDRHYHPYYGYPSEYYSQGYEDDQYSQRSQSRGAHTPASLLEDQPDAYGYGARTSSRAGYDDYHRSHYDPYYGYRQGGYHYQDQGVTEETKPGRITPKKHTIPHMKVCFGPGGQLVKVLPNNPVYGQPATVEIHEVDELLQENMETEELKSFPGPVIRGDTHKNDVLAFCQRKARACAENINMIDRESAELIWKLLELLIKQNGTVMGTDIAELLLEGHEPTTAEYSMIGLKISQSMDNLDQELDDTTEVNASTFSVTDRSIINRGRSQEEATDRFRHLLLYGRKKDALECAMKRNLWGHALFLASKMDSRTHANVMIRFANTAMKMNDPLQTLYQLMSGRQPASVTSIANERWGDWRPHLAMILSNQGSKPDLDKKSIMSMGDTLASKGFLYASHFCYIMGQASFGSYFKKTAKLVLIGINQSLPLEEFTTNEAIQCTEIYEYAMSLGNPSFFLSNFQVFKFLYACRLAENGFPQEALQYFEVISRYIQRAPTFFQPTLVKLVYNLADRLKHFDPQRMHTADDQDQAWLLQLQKISQGFQDGSIRPLSGSVTPMGYGSTRASSESAEVAGLTRPGSDLMGQGQMDYNYQTGYTQQQGYGDRPDQSQSEVDGQTEGQTFVGQQQYNYNYPQTGQQTQEQSQGEQQAQQQYTEQQYTDQQQQQYNQEQHTNYNNYYQHGYVPNNTEAQQGDSGNQTMSAEVTSQYQGYMAATSDTGVPQLDAGSVQDQASVTQTHTHNTASQPYNPNIYSQTGESSQQQSITSDSSLDTEDDANQEQQTDFDYFGAATTQKIVAPRLRKRTTSETSQGSGNRSTYPGEQAKDDKARMPPPAAKTDPSKKQGSRLGGWFSKLLPKPKNEMKLPNDDKPSIVWDKDNEKWVNLDGTEEVSKPVAEPPKDSDIFKTPAVPATPESSSALGAPPSGNKFSRPKGRGARNQYVDVMNTSGSSTSSTTVPKSLFNVMPTSASSPAIFNPLGGSDQSDSKTDPQPQQSIAPPAEQNMNQSLTPGELSRTSSMSSVSYEVQQLTRQDGKQTQAPNLTPGGPPMLFNPSQFKTGQQNAAPAGGPKLYNQRRVYPK